MQIKGKFGDKPTVATNIIIFLNSKNKYELEEVGIEDETETILEVNKFFTIKNLFLHLEQKCHGLEIGVNRFEVMNKHALPSLFVINDKLITQEDYNKKLKDVAKENSKFAGITRSIIGKAVLEEIENDLSI